MQDVVVSESKIAFGQDALEVLKDLKGNKALIVTDKIIQSLGFIDLVSKYSSETGMNLKVFNGVKPEPPVENLSLIHI